ncbi:MAG: carboxypeptidase-like regulatory domain-containing protein [Terracidiphilus sp.]|nr:carboxypeptidase-like regulatory domain-containing protein [Terracidiphilus sp.]MDR3775636.1 carboxypeptidase-like regulatory domain-containing protein [Terracidiphilus sp.]
MKARLVVRARMGLLLAIAVPLFAIGLRATAQTVFIQNVDGKRVMCMRSGLSSDLRDCGVQSDWYTSVFVGSITAVDKAPNSELKIQIVPEEIFAGNPDKPTIVFTSQGACFPTKLKVGDRWLFYLRKEIGKQIILDYYGNDSVPIQEAQEQIETLRKLKTIGSLGILRGKVWQGTSSSGSPFPNASVIAHHQPDDRQFIAVSAADGNYEFQPLPPGDYKLNVIASGALQPDDSQVEIRPGSCWNLDITRSPHARIAGQVRTSNGSPMRNIDVVLIDLNGKGYVTTQTNSEGRFHFDMLRQGGFVVGLNYPKRPDWINSSGSGVGLKLPPASLYYPGVNGRAKARVIRLTTDEKIDNVDFVLPAK